MLGAATRAATILSQRALGFRPRFFDFDAWRIRVWLGGRSPRPASAERWMLLHGLGSTSAMFLPLSRRLRRDCEILVPELSILGGTRGPRAALSISESVAALRAILGEVFGGAPSTICGVSLGGWIAVRLALAAPELVERLVLVVPAGYRDQDWSRISRMVGVDRPADVDALYRALFVRPRGYYRLARPLLHLAYASPSVRDVLATLDERDAYDDADLARIRIPVDLVWGEHDRLFELETGRRMARALQDSRLDIVREAGHALQWERTREFMEVVARFRTDFPVVPTAGRPGAGGEPWQVPNT